MDLELGLLVGVLGLGVLSGLGLLWQGMAVKEVWLAGVEDGAAFGSVSGEVMVKVQVCCCCWSCCCWSGKVEVKGVVRVRV